MRPGLPAPALALAVWHWGQCGARERRFPLSGVVRPVLQERGRGSAFLSTPASPFPRGKESPVLVSSRLLSVQVNQSFSPVLFRDVEKTSSINPYVTTTCMRNTSCPDVGTEAWLTVHRPVEVSIQAAYRVSILVGNKRLTGSYTASAFLKAGL